MSIVFGLIGMRLSSAQMISFVRKPKEKMFWWYTHLGNFIGSYIAAWTAFSVVTLPVVLGNHVWLWALADGGGGSGDCVDYGLLQAEVCASCAGRRV